MVIREMQQPTELELRKAGEELSRWLAGQRGLYPLNRDFAAAIGMSEPWLSKLLNGNKIAAPTQAACIHAVTRGVIPGSLLRPDLWRKPGHVPLDRLAGAS